MCRSRVGDTARTVAERGWTSRRLISPNQSWMPRRATRASWPFLEAFSTSSSPERTTYMSRPGSPSWKTTWPGMTEIAERVSHRYSSEGSGSAPKSPMLRSSSTVVGGGGADDTEGV
jgi:hypothetical protein